MQFLTFSCLICALNLNFAQKFLRKASLLKVAGTAKSCSKRQNFAQKLLSTIGKGPMFASSPPRTISENIQKRPSEGFKSLQKLQLEMKSSKFSEIYRHRPWVLKFRTGDVRIPPFPPPPSPFKPKDQHTNSPHRPPYIS